MKKIVWDQKFEVGNTIIDTEHHIFIAIISRIQEAEADSRKKKLLDRLLDELLKYAEFHFCSEENLMLEINYPEMLLHQKGHEQLLAELRNRIFALKYNEEAYEEMLQFLTDWFYQHTSAEDKKLAKYLKK